MRFWLLLCSSLVLACAGQGDPSDTAFVGVGGGADGFGIEDGSYTALAVLTAANTLGGNVLDDDVGLDARAVENILEARRLGDFTTLMALDDVPYVGPVAFGLLVSYVENEGLVGWCGDDVVQSNETCDGPGCSNCTAQDSTNNNATSLRINYRLVDSDEVFAGGNGWVFDDNEVEWVFEDEVRATALPVRLSTGNFFFSLRDNGRASLDYNYGDADATAEASSLFPLGGTILQGAPGTVYEIAVSGGDHASGAWSCDGTVTLTLE